MDWLGDATMLKRVGMIFAFSFFPSLSPWVLFYSKTLKRMFNKAIIVSTGLLLAILFVDFIPHIVEGGCAHTHGESHGHSHGHGAGAGGRWSKAMAALQGSHPGLIIAGLTFIGLILIDQKVIKHNHCHSDEIEEGRARKVHSHDKRKDDEAEINLCCTEGLKYQTTPRQALVFILVFSIHSFFEGLAFTDNKNNEILFLGLVVHKVLESITVGINLFYSTYTKRMSAGLLFFYSILTPLGILLATVISGLLKSWIVREIFMGLAFGSLSFIVLVEMLPPIFHSLNDSKKILLLLLGYIVGAALIGYAHQDGASP